ncbi:MAG: hypothetical protein M9894_04300 [Planctomycetes bacterium]|nr:hypothetical protein [Planctomycetota bacterium]
MRAAVALLALALAGCGVPPRLGPDVTVTGAPPGEPPHPAFVRRILRSGLGHEPDEGIVVRAREALGEHGVATIEVPHEGHVHVHVLTWHSPTRTLVIFERTADGAERVRTLVVDGDG